MALKINKNEDLLMKKIMLLMTVTLLSAISSAESILCEGITNDLNASENVKFQLAIRRDDKNPIFKNSGSFYKSTIKYFYSTGNSFAGIDIADKVSTRLNKIIFSGSASNKRNLTINYSADGVVQNIIMNYDLTIKNQPVQCEFSGSLPARPVCSEGMDKTKTLIQAIKYSNDLDAIETAIECGASINNIDRNGCTPLMFAVDPICGEKNSIPYASPFSPVTKIIDLLTSQGAFVNAVDKQGETPLIKAAKNNISDGYDIFIALEADFNIQDNLGNTALMHAARNGNIQTVEQILKGDPNRKLKNKSGETAYDIAKRWQNEAIMNLVRIADVNIIIKGHQDGSCSPLQINLKQGQVVELTLNAASKMFKMEVIDLGFELMADGNSSAKKTFTVESKGNFKFTCGFHGSNNLSEGVITVK